MSSQTTAQQEPARIYQCDAKVHETLQSVHDQLHQLCHSHTNRLVKVETIHGDVFEGHIVHCDRGVVHLRLSNEGASRAFFPGGAFPNPNFNNFVLPLVLFNLLTISLL